MVLICVDRNHYLEKERLKKKLNLVKVTPNEEILFMGETRKPCKTMFYPRLRGSSNSCRKDKFISVNTKKYSTTSFYCALLYCTSQRLYFFTNWRFVATLHRASLLAPFSQQPLPTSCLCITFRYLCSISNFFIIIIFVIVISEWSTLMLVLGLAEGSDDN